MHLGDGHFGEVPDRFKHHGGWTELIPIRRRFLVLRAQIVEIQARTVRRPIAFCDNHIDLAIGSDRFQSAHDIINELSVHRVSFFWPVENNPGDASAANFFQNYR